MDCILQQLIKVTRTKQKNTGYQLFLLSGQRHYLVLCSHSIDIDILYQDKKSRLIRSARLDLTLYLNEAVSTELPCLS